MIDPEINKKTVSWYLHQWVQSGQIHRIGRGLYTFEDKQPFTPPLTNTIRRIAGTLKRELPLVAYCIWDTALLDHLIVFQPTRHYTLVEPEKEATEAVFNKIAEFSKQVFLQPDRDVLDRYVSNLKEAIIVRSKVTEAPCFDREGIPYATLEKILVDCIIDRDLFVAYQSALEQLFTNAFDRYAVNRSTMQRYARRREKEEQLKQFIQQIEQNL
jgi:hypothetical protein